MIDVVGLEDDPGELLEQVILLVGRPIRSDYADSAALAGFHRFPKALSYQLQRFFPGSRRQPPVLADKRLAEPVLMIGKIESVASLDAQEIAIDAALVAVIAAHNLRAGVRAAHTQGGLAAIAAMRTDGAHVVHFPGPRFVAISAGSQRSHRANVDAHAAFFAFQMVFAIGRDHRTGAAILNAQRRHVHAFGADAHAAVAQNAARTVKVNHRRPLLLILVQLGLHVFRFCRAVAEGHVLQLALAAGVTYRTI